MRLASDKRILNTIATPVSPFPIPNRHLHPRAGGHAQANAEIVSDLVRYAIRNKIIEP
jgi:hypothetical protein